MKYYRVQENFSLFGDRWHLDEPLDEFDREIDARLFRYGEAYQGQPPKTIFVDTPGTEVAFTLGPFNMPVIRADVRAVIESIAKDGVEFYPVEVVGSSSSFSIMNVTTIINCVDESASVFKKFGPGTVRPDLPNAYEYFSKLIVDPNRIQSDIFRIENFAIGLIVSDTIRSKLISMLDLGVGFLEV